MGRIARRIDRAKIARLRVKIEDPRYLTEAVEGLAIRMTERLVNADPGDVQCYLSSNSSNSVEELLRTRAE